MIPDAAYDKNILRFREVLCNISAEKWFMVLRFVLVFVDDRIIFCRHAKKGLCQIFKPPAMRKMSVFVCLFLPTAVHNDDRMDRTEIFTEAHKPVHKVGAAHPDRIRSADTEFDDSADTEQSVADFQTFFFQIDPEC